MTPSARTKQLFEKHGYLVERVERDMKFPNKERPGQWRMWKQDLLGFGDHLVVGCDSILLIQTTSGSNLADRQMKIVNEPRAHKWLANGGRILAIGWRQVMAFDSGDSPDKAGCRYRKKSWQPRIMELRNAHNCLHPVKLEWSERMIRETGEIDLKQPAPPAEGATR